MQVHRVCIEPLNKNSLDAVNIASFYSKTKSSFALGFTKNANPVPHSTVVWTSQQHRSVPMAGVSAQTLRILSLLLNYVRQHCHLGNTVTQQS